MQGNIMFPSFIFFLTLDMYMGHSIIAVNCQQLRFSIINVFRFFLL